MSTRTTTAGVVQAGSSAQVDTISDEELVERLLERDTEAFGMLYDRYAHAAYCLACRMLGNTHQAEDLVQDVFLALWRLPERFKADRGSARTYILSMTHHRAIDLQRSRSRHAIDADVEQIALVPAGTDVEHSTLRSLEAEVLRAALRLLPESQRRVVELAFIGGYSYPEITRILGVPLGTVKSRLRLAMDRLRRAPEIAGLAPAMP